MRNPVLRGFLAFLLSLGVAGIVFALFGFVLPVIVTGALQYDPDPVLNLVVHLVVGILCLIGMTMLAIYFYERWEGGVASGKYGA